MTSARTVLSSLAVLSLLAVAACGGVIDPNDALGQPLTVGAAGAGGGEDGGAGSGSSGSAGATSNGAAAAGGTPGHEAPVAQPACWADELAPEAPREGYGAPITTLSGCSMTGTWDVTPGEVSFATFPKTISFDDQGRFVAGTPGADLCSGFTRSGFYTAREFGEEYAIAGLSGKSLLMLASTRGDDLHACEENGESGYSVDPVGGCDTLSVLVRIDSCTGVGIFRDGGLLTRRH